MCNYICQGGEGVKEIEKNAKHILLSWEGGVLSSSRGDYTSPLYTLIFFDFFFILLRFHLLTYLNRVFATDGFYLITNNAKFSANFDLVYEEAKIHVFQTAKNNIIIWLFTEFGT